MANRLRERLGCEFRLMAVSPHRDVVAAVSRAGGFGVFGASSHTPRQLELELQLIDEHIDGYPYGVDILMPEHVAVTGKVDPAALAAAVPDAQVAPSRGSCCRIKALATAASTGRPRRTRRRSDAVWTESVWLATTEAEVSPVF